MMTSVTLPSTSGPLHGGYSSSVAEETTTSSEPDFETPRPPLKRCLVTPLGGAAGAADSCKKRRKQSTPIRISAAESEQHPQHPQCTEGKPTASTTPPESELQCPVCQLYFNNQEQLQNHIISDHSVSAIDCKKEPDDFSVNPPQIDQQQSSETPLGLTTPTNRPDVPWMNELQNKEWMSPNLHGLPYNPTNSMYLTLPQFVQPENMPRQPIRIFNPDAYCDLCNKEFCNKYFLKTHKANKHGIYSDPPSSEPPLVNNVNIASFAGTIKLPTSVPSVEISTVKNEPKSTSNIINPFSNLFPNPFSNKSFPKSSKNNVQHLYESESNDNVPNSNGFSSNSESDKITPDDQPTEESSSPRNLQTESTSYKNDSDGIFYIPQSKMSPSNELDISNRLRRIGVMNPKAFCEICCKEYCNKYFLRTHKMKRHGIYIPDEKDKDNNKLESANNFLWQNNMQTSPLNLIMTEQSSTDRKTTSPPDISCDICGIKFQNASLSQLHNVSMHPNKNQNNKEEEHQESEDNKRKPLDTSTSTDKSLNTEAISEDLQKLQTMILQLNELDVSKVSTTCNACNKEFENRYFLHAHMMTEHGILLDDVSDAEKPPESENSSNNNTLCDLCGKDVPNVDEMKKHMMESHPNHPAGTEGIKEEFNSGFSTPEKNTNKTPVSSAERRISMNVTPTSSYCDICNKELCNKYFMKTHMQRMHGIEIENGAQIGGVICDICNKELCSKYFLRVHKHNTHGIVEYGTSLLPPRKSDGESTQHAPPAEPEPALKPADLADLSHRYFTHFTEVCTICNRRFRSTKWLKAHLLSDHGQTGADKWAELEQQLQQNIGQHSKSSVSNVTNSGIKIERTSPTLKIPNGGQEKLGIQNVLSSLFGVDESNSKSYQCSFCPYTTPLLPLLFVHERSHSMSSEGGGGASLKCPVCTQSFLQPELLQHHMFAQHPLLPLPPFFNGNNENTGETSKEPSESAAEDDPTKGEDGGKSKKVKGGKVRRIELSSEIGQALNDVAKKTQVPASYAVPQGEEVASPGYVMQAFLLEESNPDRRVVPAVVFLPVFQKQPAPLTVTFTLTPA